MPEMTLNQLNNVVMASTSASEVTRQLDAHSASLDNEDEEGDSSYEPDGQTSFHASQVSIASRPKRLRKRPNRYGSAEWWNSGDIED